MGTKGTGQAREYSEIEAGRMKPSYSNVTVQCSPDFEAILFFSNAECKSKSSWGVGDLL